VSLPGARGNANFVEIDLAAKLGEIRALFHELGTFLSIAITSIDAISSMTIYASRMIVGHSIFGITSKRY
jgi:hypothetical protein